jgi:protein SCO1
MQGMMAQTLVTLLVCCASVGAQQRYAASAIILKVDRNHKTFVASCKSIPGYMEEMVMPFKVHDEKLLDGFGRGTVVDFTVVVTDDDSFAEDLKVHHFQRTEPEPFEARGLQLLENFGQTNQTARELKTGEVVPDFTLTDQTDHRISLSQFRGKVVTIAFAYTRCPLPNYCFRLSNNLGQLQRRFADQMGRDLILLTVTIDPVHDTPAVLAKYATIWKADPISWHFLTGPEAEVKAVCSKFGANSWPEDGALTHSLHTVVIDRRGYLAANFEGNEFTAVQLGDFLATVMK